MSAVRGPVQPPEVCLPLTLARESHLPLGLRLQQLANLPPGADQTPPPDLIQLLILKSCYRYSHVYQWSLP